jgi:hypothetical protein
MVTNTLLSRYRTPDHYLQGADMKVVTNFDTKCTRYCLSLKGAYAKESCHCCMRGRVVYGLRGICNSNLESCEAPLIKIYILVLTY